MLPTHVLAHAVGFLHFDDLDALLLTDDRCSDVAHVAASEIRVFDFSEFHFDVYDSRVDVFKLETYEWAAELELANEKELLGFIPPALQNCMLEALRDVAHTTVVKDALELFHNFFDNVHALVEFAFSFRNVQRVRICFSGPQIEELVAALDRHGFSIQPDTSRSIWVSFVTRSA